MFCKYCGRQINDNAQFCPYCGKQLGTANEGHIKQRNNKQKKGKKAPRRVWRWLVCLTLLVIVAIALLFALKKRNGNNTQVSVRADDSLYTPDDNAVETDEEMGISFVNNIIIIFFQPDTDQELINSTIASIGGEVVGKLDFIDQYQVRVAKHSLEELKYLCDELEKDEHVLAATYDEAFAISPETIPKDPWAGHWWSPQQWSQETPDGANWWAEVINAPDAWDYDSYYSDIKIGVVDNGFDIGHEDLKNVIKSVSLNNDSQGHGTHVSGIIGAEANNDKGITGIVWNCSILASDWELNTIQKIADFIDGQNWSTTTQILGGVSVLVKEGAKIVNISAGQSKRMEGTDRSKREIDYQGYTSSMYLCALLSKGYDFVVVQSAGNGNKSKISVDAINNGLFCSVNEENCVHYGEVTTKDIIDRIIVVGAAERDGDDKYTQCSFSNAGNRVDICAPGKDIYSTVPGGWSGKYEYSDGTSMAAPIVTGVAALVWQVNPKLRGDQVKRIVCRKENTKYTVEDNTTQKHPLVNTYRMVNASLAVQAAIKSLTVDPDEEFVWKIKTAEDDKSSDDSNPTGSYIGIIEKLEKEYGSLEINICKTDNSEVGNDYRKEADGLCYLELLDFNNDGVKELLAVAKHMSDEDYTIYVYTIENNSVKELLTSNSILNNFDDDYRDLYIKTNYDHESFIDGGFSYDGFEYYKIYGMKGNAFGLISASSIIDTYNRVGYDSRKYYYVFDYPPERIDASELLKEPGISREEYETKIDEWICNYQYDYKLITLMYGLTESDVQSGYQREDDKIVLEKAITKTKEEVGIIQDSSNSEGANNDTWKKSYIDYIETDPDVINDTDWCTCGLIYLDNDDVPELIIDYGIEADGTRIVSCKNDELVSYQFARTGGIKYYEREGLVYNSIGVVGTMFDEFAFLDSEGFHDQGRGYRYDESQMGSNYTYFNWNGEDVSEKEYYSKINSFDDERAKHWNSYSEEYRDNNYSIDEMRELLMDN